MELLNGKSTGLKVKISCNFVAILVIRLCWTDILASEPRVIGDGDQLALTYGPISYDITSDSKNKKTHNFQILGTLESLISSSPNTSYDKFLLHDKFLKGKFHACSIQNCCFSKLIPFISTQNALINAT